MYYRDPALFGNQPVVDRCVDMIASRLNVRRSDLNVVSDEYFERYSQGSFLDCCRQRATTGSARHSEERRNTARSYSCTSGGSHTGYARPFSGENGQRAMGFGHRERGLCIVESTGMNPVDIWRLLSSLSYRRILVKIYARVELS